MAQLRVVIVDDEFHARENLKLILSEYYSNQIECVGEASNGNDALMLAQEMEFDLIFLDIQLSDGLSFEIFEEVTVDSAIIFTTAYDEYAIKTYELEVLDYLMKPISFPRFLKTVNRAFKELNSNLTSNLKVAKRAHIFIKVDKKKMQKIYLDEN